MDAPKPCSSIDRLLEVMARLRDPVNGCPWDIEQDFASIAPYTIEEAYEVADAIERSDIAALKDELGDLLLQVVYHARMAEEIGAFDFHEVAEAISDKMVRRHPHVFGEERVESAAAQTVSWEETKAAERAAKAAAGGDAGPARMLDGVAVGLPATTRAAKLQKRVARVGFDWPDVAPIFAKIDEEAAELKAEIAQAQNQDRIEDEAGDLLFVMVNLARKLDVDPESALRRTNAKFERRFRAVEDRFAAQGRPLGEVGLDEMEAAWQAVKAEER